MNTKTLPELLEISSGLHGCLCPRQILGVHMGMYAGALLNLTLPQSDKHLLVITETDGCFAGGLSAATNATVGHRTLRVEDYGKTVAVFFAASVHSADINVLQGGMPSRSTLIGKKKPHYKTRQFC